MCWTNRNNRFFQFFGGNETSAMVWTTRTRQENQGCISCTAGINQWTNKNDTSASKGKPRENHELRRVHSTWPSDMPAWSHPWRLVQQLVPPCWGSPGWRHPGSWTWVQDPPAELLGLPQIFRRLTRPYQHMKHPTEILGEILLGSWWILRFWSICEKEMVEEEVLKVKRCLGETEPCVCRRLPAHNASRV